MGYQGPGPKAQQPGAPRAIPFGKYLLLDRIAVGGMAEVYTAKSFGIEGFEKFIAIKRILPTMAEDKDFITMFIDEAKIAGHLTHANIVPIYELGKIGESHYIAMEYVWGKDLLQIMNRFRRMRRHMPPVMAAWMASKMLEGLDYAHRKRDRHGRAMGIIHRDVSPQNILISYEGQVKLIDFGIAKAASRNTKTQAGVLKGKFGYMSPEQVRGNPVDHRSDIFAASTCLHEMLTGERLFVGESDFSTLEKVRNAEVIPPSQRIPALPKELEEIVLKGLAREPDQRWQTAGEMQEALQRFIALQKPPFGTSKLNTWMRTAFAPEITKEKQRLDRYAQVTRPPAQDPAASSLPRSSGLPAASLSQASPAAPVAQAAPASQDFDLGDDDFIGEATMISASPFEEMLAQAEARGELNTPAGNPPQNGEIPEQPTQIFFSLDEMEEIIEETPARAPAGSLSSIPPAPPRGQIPGMNALPPVGQLPGASPHAGNAGRLSAPNVAAHGAASFPGQAANPASPMASAAVAQPGFNQPPTQPSQRAVPTMEVDRISPEGTASQTTRSQTKLGLILAVAALLLLAISVVLGLVLIPNGNAAIAVRAVPENVGAVVYIDNQPRGAAPIELQDVEPGTHVIEVRAPNYQPSRRTVDVQSGSSAMLEIALLPAPNSQPIQAGTPTGSSTPETANANPSAATTATGSPAATTPTAATPVAPRSPTPTPQPTAPTRTNNATAQADNRTTTTTTRTATNRATPPQLPEPTAPSTQRSETARSETARSETARSETARSNATNENNATEAPQRRPAIPRRITSRNATNSGSTPNNANDAPARPTARPRGSGYLVIQTLPWARVFVDGRDTGRNTPVGRLRVSAGHHEIGLRTNDGTMHTVEVDVEPGETQRITRRLE